MIMSATRKKVKRFPVVASLMFCVAIQYGPY